MKIGTMIKFLALAMLAIALLGPATAMAQVQPASVDEAATLARANNPSLGYGRGLAALAAAVAVVGAGIGIGMIGAVESIARQPEAAGDIRGSMILTAALIEGAALFGIVVAFLASAA